MKNNLLEIKFAEVLGGMRTQSEVVTLDFKQIDKGIPEYKNIEVFLNHQYQTTVILDCLKTDSNSITPFFKSRVKSIS